MKLSFRQVVSGSLLAIVVAAVYGSATHGRFQLPFTSGSAYAGSGGENKVLFWYDAMEPSHHYDKPGKAPDGMDLVAKYAEDAPLQSHSSGPMSPAPRSASTANSASERNVLYWYDPMHPAYKSDKPGIAPDCGMALVAKYSDEPDSSRLASGSITVPPEKQVLAGVRTAVVARTQLVRTIRTTAQIVADETRIAHIHVKVAGYIDKVYVDFVGQLVKKGQPLFTLYSPDLVSTEEEYLIAKRGEASMREAPFPEVSDGAKSLLNSTRERLRLWDITDEQIQELDRTGKIVRDMTFYSPITGFITDRKAFPQTSVTPDTDLYTVSDLSTVWAEAQIYESEVPFVHVGQKMSITLSYDAGKTYSGAITYIYPTVDPQTRTVKVRIQLPNPGFALKPQMFADAQLKVDYGVHVLVPQEAVLNSGTEQHAFVVREGGVFEPRKITLGPAVDGNVAVLSGLKPGEMVVVSGNFLIDSESKLKASMSGMDR